MARKIPTSRSISNMLSVGRNVVLFSERKATTVNSAISIQATARRRRKKRPAKSRGWIQRRVPSGLCVGSTRSPPVGGPPACVVIRPDPLLSIGRRRGGLALAIHALRRPGIRRIGADERAHVGGQRADLVGLS